MRIPATSVEYVKALVTASVDPTGLPVEIAIVTGTGNPVEADWQAATWDGAAVLTPDGYEVNAVLLAGPFVPGKYTVWVRVTSTPEIPVMASGPLLAY